MHVLDPQIDYYVHQTAIKVVILTLTWLTDKE